MASAVITKDHEFEPMRHATQPLPLDRRLERVGQHVVRARLFLDLWFYFEGQDTRPEILDTMREYNEFFRFTPHAYLVSYVIYMAGVFDKTKGTISLERLFRELKAAGHLESKDAKAVGTLLARANTIVEKVALLRNNALAHRSASTLYDDVFKMAAVTVDQLRELAELALEIANRLSLARGLQEQSFTDLPREAAAAMMKALGAHERHRLDE